MNQRISQVYTTIKVDITSMNIHALMNFSIIRPVLKYLAILL